MDTPKKADRATRRLAKVIAASGLASRRAAGAWSRMAGSPSRRRFRTPATPWRTGTTSAGQVPAGAPERAYYLLFKPRGVLTTLDDPEGRRTVEFIAGLPVAVGRRAPRHGAEAFFTNDGELAHQLTHPIRNLPKRYIVKVWKTPHPKQLARLKRGITLEDGRTKPALIRPVEATDTGNTWYEVTVTEGRNRLVRRMFEAIGHPVSKLRRESFATISLRKMDRGDIRPLTGQEVQRLREIADGRDPREAGHGSRYKKGFARPKPRGIKPGYKKRRQSPTRKKR